MDNIKFSPDGWYSVIADRFTVPNLARAARGISRWLISQHKEMPPTVVIGYDTRFGGPMFAEIISQVLAVGGVKVCLSDRFVTSPMVSLGVVKRNASLGIIITGSHNAYIYSGIKIKGSTGGPLSDSDIRNIETMIPEVNEIHLKIHQFNEFVDKKMIEYIDLEELYINHVKENLDLDLIAGSGFSFSFDAMYGASQKLIQKLLPGIRVLHCEQDLAFGGNSPEPINSNLWELSALIRNDGNNGCGMAVDGDACRVSLIDEYGNFVDANHIMLLLINYLHKRKGIEGKVVAGFSSTMRLEKLCHHYALTVQRVKSGFREISNIMLKEDVLVGGEESGGISVFSHLPDRDGIWAGLIVWQFMSETGKSLRQLLDEVYDITGPFSFERLEVALDKSRRIAIIEKCSKGQFRRFGDRVVEKLETLEGFKFFFETGEWLLIRPSGEPGSFLKMYAESSSPETALEILEHARNTVLEAVPG
jgi:phosphomannomutase